MHVLDLSVYHFQGPDLPWEVEPLWARRARIEQQRLAEPFGLRLMRMTKDAEVWLLAIQKGSPTFCELPTFIQNMTDGNAAACQFDHGLGQKYALFIIVDVAGGHCDRGSELSLTFRMPNPWSSLNHRWL